MIIPYSWMALFLNGIIANDLMLAFQASVLRYYSKTAIFLFGPYLGQSFWLLLEPLFGHCLENSFRPLGGHDLVTS